MLTSRSSSYWSITIISIEICYLQMDLQSMHASYSEQSQDIPEKKQTYRKFREELEKLSRMLEEFQPLKSKGQQNLKRENALLRAQVQQMKEANRVLKEENGSLVAALRSHGIQKEVRFKTVPSLDLTNVLRYKAGHSPLHMENVENKNGQREHKIPAQRQEPKEETRAVGHNYGSQQSRLNQVPFPQIIPSVFEQRSIDHHFNHSINLMPLHSSASMPNDLLRKQDYPIEKHSPIASFQREVPQIEQLIGVITELAEELKVMKHKKKNTNCRHQLQHRTNKQENDVKSPFDTKVAKLYLNNMQRIEESVTRPYVIRQNYADKGDLVNKIANLKRQNAKLREVSLHT